jgi:cytochrome c peroxidase
MKIKGVARLIGGMAICCLVHGAYADAATTQRAPDEAGLTDPQLLGKRIFEDARLSEPQGMSCMSCHAPEHAFQGNNGSKIPAVALGSRPGQFGTRKTPTIMYKSYSPDFGFYKDIDDGKETLEAKGGQFWDGRAKNLAEQISGPLTNPLEMNNPSTDAVVAKVKDADYAELMKALYGEAIFDDPKAAMDKIAGAVTAYEETKRFAPFSSKFDDWLRGKAQLSSQELHGYKLFIDPNKGNCTACHAGDPKSKDPNDWIFTDFTYVALGAPRNAAIPANADPAFKDLGLCAQPGLAQKLPKEIALDSLCGMFKAPTLRNIAVTGPYFHNGVISSLREAVTIYATRDTDPAHWYPRQGNGVNKYDDLTDAAKANVDIKEVPYDRKPGQNARLNYEEIDALVAFLNTLTDKGMK